MSDDPNSSQNLPPNKKPLSERQLAAIALLVAGNTYAAVADALDVDRRTLWEWRQNPEFVAVLGAELDAVRAEARTRLIGLAAQAIDTLEHVMANGYTDAERISAARLVLKWIEPTNDPEQGRC